MNGEWRFGVIGNIVRTHEEDDGSVYYGTREFVGGTRVYIDGRNWRRYPRSKIQVIGLNRNHKYDLGDVLPAHIENVRFKIVRKTEVLQIMDAVSFMDGWDWWERTSIDRKEAKKFVEDWEQIVEEAKSIEKREAEEQIIASSDS